MRKILITAILLFITRVFFAQTTDAKMPDVIPPSPNAQTFLKYGDFPVSNFTGIPDISIPIYQIQLQDFVSPISLEYNASGIKVDEDASRTGLGWTINTGGLISRTINGGDDLGDYRRYPYLNSQLWNYRMSEGQIKYPVIHGCSWNFTGPSGSLLEMIFGSKKHDLAPDIFNYSFNGYSGSFSLTHDGLIYKQSSDNLIITSKIGPEKDGLNWEITTPDGTTYIFNQREYHQAQNISQTQSKQISTWYLSEIRTINGNRISFQYNVQKAYSFSLSGISQQYGSKGSNVPALETSQPYLNASLYDIVTLTNITFPNGNISFNYSYDRKDQPYEPRLQSLIVKNSQNNEIIKQVNFNYDYFQANASGNEVITIGRIKEIIGNWSNHPFYKAISDDWNKFRLKLTGVDFLGGDKKEIYQFKYNEKSLPTKLSTSRDHWGYYNGKLNSHLIPSQQFKNPLRSIESIEGGLSYYPADREVDTNYSQAFILNEITYPTGGKTNFDFESNRYNTAIFDGDPLRVNYLFAKKDVSIIATPSNRGPAYGPFSKQYFSISQADCTINGTVTASLAQRIIFNTVSRDELPLGIQFIVKVTNTTTGQVVHSSNDNKYFYTFNNNSNNDRTKNEITLTIRNIIMAPGNYELEVSGDLRSYLNSFYLELTWLTSPESYLINNPVSYAGGLRISKITSTSNNQIVYTKTYSYDINNAVLTTNYPRYWNIDFTGNSRDVFISSSGLRSHKTPVGYGIVTIYQGNGSGSNGYSVYQYKVMPDKHLDYSFRGNGYENVATNFLLPFDYAPTGSSSLTFSYIQNGALLEERHAKKENNIYSIIKQVNYNYETTDENILWGIVIPSGGTLDNPVTNIDALCKLNSYLPSLSAYLYPAINPQWNRLTKKIEQEINGNNITETVTDYKYNQINKEIKSQESYNSNGHKQTITYSYPVDISSDINTKLKGFNKVSDILEIKKEDNGKLRHIVNDYSLFGLIPRISNVKTNTAKDQSLEARIAYINYDSFGNPVYITKDDITKVIYLWGYNGQYPIAEIKNMGYTYTEIENMVKSIFSVTSIDALSKQATPTETKLKDGSLQNALPDALITTYTYKPLVGILTATDPRGVITYYDYDAFGRLKETYIIENNIKRIIQVNDYHYQNQ